MTSLSPEVLKIKKAKGKNMANNSNKKLAVLIAIVCIIVLAIGLMVYFGNIVSLDR